MTMDSIAPYVNKTVPLRFKGQDLSFDLSHALFSSFDIDQGSRLLLKAVAQRVAVESVASIVDIGSGVGVLGVACARAYPGASLILRDRDALASAFSERNARRNRVAPEAVETALFLEGLEARRFDLALCNVPAKAGPPVLDRFLRDLPRVLSERGRGAVVVVEPIAEAARHSLLAGGAELVHEERGPGHLAIIFSRGRSPDAEALGEAFWLASRRGEHSIRTNRGAYPLTGRWGLPEFDTPTFDTALMMDLTDAATAGLHLRRLAVINPGVGRLACHLSSRARSASLDLCGRDAFALAATRRNLVAARVPHPGPPLEAPGAEAKSEGSGLAVPFSWDLPAAAYDLVAERPDLVPRLDPGPLAWAEAARVLKRGGSYLVAMPSTAMDRFERQRPKGFVRIAERRRKGFVCAAWRFEG